MPLILELIKCNVVKQCTSALCGMMTMDLSKTVRMSLILIMMIFKRYLIYFDKICECYDFRNEIF